MDGSRVKVMSGNGQTDLGLGTLVGCVPVYFFRGPEGNLLSDKLCEKKPSRAQICVMKLSGATLVEKQANPKIVLDNGDTVYGCQVWWSKA